MGDYGQTATFVKYTKAQMGEAKANLQRALKAGNKLRRKIKAQRKKADVN